MTLKDIIKALENKWIAMITSLIVLLIFYNIYPKTWQFLFSILLAYLIADLIKSLLIKGGKGIIQFPFTSETQTRHEGHGYIIFLLYIIAGTLLSAWLGDYITKNFIETLTGWQSWLFPNLIIIVLIYFDFWVTFKKR